MESVKWEYRLIGEPDRKKLMDAAIQAGWEGWEAVGFSFYEKIFGGEMLFKRPLKKSAESKDDDSAEVVLIGDRYAVRKKIDGEFKYLDIYMGNEENSEPNWGDIDDPDFEGIFTTNTKEDAFVQLEWLNKERPSRFGTPVDPDD